MPASLAESNPAQRRGSRRMAAAPDVRPDRRGLRTGARVAKPDAARANRPAALASAPILKQDRPMTLIAATAELSSAAFAGRSRAAAANARANNNNRNNASLPRAGD